MGYRRFSLAGAVVASALALGFGAVPGGAATQADTAATATPETAAASAEVTGFRSARFGMDEKAVRAAIAEDFDKDDAEIQKSVNNVERTKLLTISVPGLLEDGGTAQVSYIFGYESKTLIQVGASWSKATDPDMTAATLVANGDVLSDHFAREGFAPDTIITGTVVDNGLLLFRGEDAEGRAAILLLQGNFKQDDKDAKGRKRLNPVGLTLLYSVAPDDPDIFRVESGDF